MPDYRVYVLDLSGHFSDVIQLECADDDEAMKQAEQLVDGHDVELWQRARKIRTYAARNVSRAP
jgi:hypothetical protein